MINFSNIAEMCLNGQLTGTFVTRDGEKFYSKFLRKSLDGKKYPYWFSFGECTYQTMIHSYMVDGESAIAHARYVIDFIPEVEVKKHKYVYEFDESPAKRLHSNEINLIATKITVDGKILKNRYGKIDV